MDNLPPGARERLGSLGPAVCVAMQSTAAARNIKRGGRKRAQSERFSDNEYKLQVTYTHGCTDAGTWQLTVPPSSHGLRKMLFDSWPNDRRIGLRRPAVYQRDQEDGRPVDPPLERLEVIRRPTEMSQANPLEAQHIADRNGSLAMQASVRMMWTASFFLCRPGEYGEGNKLFRLCDMGLPQPETAPWT
ncbi:hypothetical protein THAOC_34908 [Thalassiosira oceanica]|uniref:Uncharacterized protein n=1 Tax=Thalassiosira oceanica TaxID=159749 RepID=K0RIE6_THAOC|nr:hypothetical protein THAOC_34908 [Thalassiosira oceanica]|eukprot:EJK46422.1 hypothetical protein THAOC_34908 [Thalassiosira oceanica]